MKRFFILLLLLSGFLFGQQLSPYLQYVKTTSLAKGNAQTLHLLIRGDEQLVQKLHQAGFTTESELGSMATVRVSNADIQRLLKVPGVQRITLTPRRRLYNSKAVNYQHVHAAYNQGYTGSGVIIGVVDTGIDFYHNMFRKQNGDTRILYIWDQTLNGGGPAGTTFTYGIEYAESQINQDLASGNPNSIVLQKDTQGHGTHVAGSAAGDDLTLSPADTLHGGAEDANLIIVKTTLENAAIIDGVKYIFDKAEALGKPCVINLSLGSQYGPHDGSDDDNLAFDTMVGPGKIIVQAAGNDGNHAVHYFDSTNVSSDQIQFSYTQYVTAWIEKGDNLGNASLSWDTGSIDNVVPGGQKSFGQIYLSVYPASASNNQEIEVEVYMNDDSFQGKTFTLTLNALSDGNGNNKITRHAWSDGNVLVSPSGGFSQGTSYQYVHYPFTLSNDACATKVITVGAFISRESWDASDGNTYHYPNSGKEGGIASFSGIGPTADGRNKPDIIAGGQIVLSAKSKDYSVTDPGLLPPAPFTDYYYYTQGTSMASPVAAGAIALLLEKNPGWTPDDVKNYLFNHAQGTSATTGGTPQEVAVKTDPNTWDRVFGYGAIDLTYAFGPDAIDDETPAVIGDFRLEQNYPNPFNPITSIKYQVASTAHVKLTVYNILGQIVKELVNSKQQAGAHQVIFDAASLSSGVYYYKITVNNKFAQTKKMILMR